jgi:hypothetical protein
MGVLEHGSDGIAIWNSRIIPQSGRFQGFSSFGLGPGNWYITSMSKKVSLGGFSGRGCPVTSESLQRQLPKIVRMTLSLPLTRWWRKPYAAKPVNSRGD